LTLDVLDEPAAGPGLRRTVNLLLVPVAKSGGMLVFKYLALHPRTRLCVANLVTTHLPAFPALPETDK
jgi:hypothetical protein